MNDWRNEVLSKLVKERDQVEMYRLQGELKAIDQINGLPGIMHDYAKGLQDKTMKPIGEVKDGKPIQV